MPSIFTHAAVPLAMRLAAGPGRISRRLLGVGVAAAMLPDADTLAFALGIPYADDFGHRGALHSLAFALLVAACTALAWRPLRSTPLQAGVWTFACAASHPLLDAMTSGGLGVALLWPFDTTRYFMPWRPIRVSPIGVGFFSARGLATLWSELRWGWLPLFAAAAAWRAIGNAPAQNIDTHP